MATKEAVLTDSDDLNKLDPKSKKKKATPAPAAVSAAPIPEAKPKIRGEKKKGKGKLIFVIVLLLFIGAGVAVIGFNILGIRDRYLTGLLRNIPIINNLLPSESLTVDDPYAGKTFEELTAEIERLKLEMTQKEEDYNALLDKNNRNVRELDTLKDIESQYEQHSKDKAEFDQMIGSKDPQAYAKFYESIDPVNAEKIYAEAVKTNAASDEIKKYVATFTEMDASAAAQILDGLTATDAVLVVNIFQHMPTSNRAEILAEMRVENATVITKRMSSVFDPE